MPDLNRVLLQTFQLRSDIVEFEINRRLRDLFPGQAVLVTSDCDFDLLGFAEDGRCALWTLEDLEPLLLAQWRGREKGTRFAPKHSFCEVLWNGAVLRCLTITNEWDETTFLLSEDPEAGRRFFDAVCLWSTDSDGSITVYDGRFRRDKELEQAVKAASWESLVLPSSVKDRLYRDVTQFFVSKDAYHKFGVPWRRGVLLFGPPGNGKTHAIKALLRETAHPCLVVRSLNTLKHHRDTDEHAITTVFNRARQMAPATLLLEDIDSLAARSNLSSLLNELDGLAKNNGLLCLATTNHLDRLDVALSNRPSRFDRKYEFGNPKLRERLRFLESRFERLEPGMRPSKESLEGAAKASKGFSGAMLQELVGACALRWIGTQQEGTMDRILAEELVLLGSRPVKPAAPAAGEK